MNVKDEIIKKVQAMPEDSARHLLDFINSQREATPLRRFGSFMDSLAESIPDSELEEIPSDASERVDDHAYDKMPP